jgi:hypothetical protein
MPSRRPPYSIFSGSVTDTPSAKDCKSSGIPAGSVVIQNTGTTNNLLYSFNGTDYLTLPPQGMITYNARCSSITLKCSTALTTTAEISGTADDSN